MLFRSAGADGRRQSRTQCLKGRDCRFVLVVPDHVLVEQAADGVLHPKADVPHLKKAGDDRRQNAGGQQKPHAYLRPDKPVDDVVYLRYHGK